MPSPSLSSSALRLPLLDQTFKKRLIVAAGLAVLQALSFPAYSAEPDDERDSLETETTEDVELQPSYVRPDYVEIERLRTTKEIVVLPKEVIRERGNRTISDVLQSVPGISVGTTGAGEIDIRGQGAGQANRNIQVLIDGAPITTLVNHPMSTNYDVVPVEQIERIEVIPGGGSVLYGSGASGGIVNITTDLRAMEDPKNTANIEWNSDGYRLSANVGSKFLDDRFAFTASASKLDRDLWFNDTYRNSEYYSAGLRFNATDTQTVVLRVSHLTEDSQYVGSVTPEVIEKYGKDYVPTITETIGRDPVTGSWMQRTRTTYLNGDRDLTTVNATYTNDISDRIHFTGDVFYTEGFYTNIDSGENQRMEHDGHGTRMKLDLGYGEDSNLLIGFDYSRQKASLEYDGKKLGNPMFKPDGTYNYLPEPYSFNYDRELTALYLLNTNRIDSFEFTQGVRGERTDWKFDKTGQNIAGASTSGRWNSAFELSAAWLYRDTGRIYARYERGYTTPDGIQISDERYFGTTRVYTETDADDETFDLFEIGLRDQIGFTTLSLTLWYSETDNQMDRIKMQGEGSYPFYRDTRTMNIYKTKRYGADVSLTQNFDKLTLEESYAWVHGETDYNSKGRALVESGSDFVSSGLQAVPEHKVTVSATYDFTDDLSANVLYRYVGSYNNFMKEDQRANGVMKSYSTVDASLHWHVNKYLELYGGVTNLTDETYYEYVMPSSNQYVTPGRERTFFVGLRGTY